MNQPLDIKLLGTPSTTFTYVRHVLGKVMERAKLSQPIQEITNIQQIIKNQVEVIPTLIINEQDFPFHADKNTSEILKEAVLYLLRKSKQHQWPVLLLATEKVGDAFLLACDLSKPDNALIEWILQDRSKFNEQNEELLQRRGIADIIKSSRSDWMGQLFSEPLINYRISQQAAKSASISIGKEEGRNNTAIITDRYPKFNWPLLFNWMEHSNIPLIITPGNDYYQLPKKIIIVGNVNEQLSIKQLQHLLHVKRNNISSLSKLKVLSDGSPDETFHSTGLHSFEDELYDLPPDLQPDMWAFHFEDKKTLKEMLNRRSFRRWMNSLEQSIVFLPFNT
jgi:hypothetical protein